MIKQTMIIFSNQFIYFGILCILLASFGVICNASWILHPQPSDDRQNFDYANYLSLVQDPITRDEASKLLNPAFFVIGYQKCGTTSLFHYFMDHPGAIHYGHKEGNFFLSKENPDNNTRTEAHLQHLHDAYPPRSVAMSGDFSILYAYCAKVPVQVSTLLPTAKIVVCIREPVSRAKSNFLMGTRFAKRGNKFVPPFDPTSFDRTMRMQMNIINQCRIEYPDQSDLWRWSNCYIDQNDICFKDMVHKKTGNYYIVAGGMYVRSIELWMNNFPQEHFLFIPIDDMKNDQAGTTNKFFNFVGMSDHQVSSAVFNKKHGHSYDWTIEDTTMEFTLSKLYHSYNLELRVFLDEHGHSDTKLWD